jgi:hypothetical protein
MRFLKSLIVKKWEIWGYNMDIQGIYNGDLLGYYINGAGDLNEIVFVSSMISFLHERGLSSSHFDRGKYSH